MIYTMDWLIIDFETPNSKYIDYVPTYSLWSLANWTPKLHNSTFVKMELKRAFKLWSDYSRLEFLESDNYYNSDIIIAFGRYNHGDMFPFDGPGFVLAHAYYPYELGSYGALWAKTIGKYIQYEMFAKMVARL